MIFGDPFEAPNGTVVIPVSSSRGRPLGIYAVTAEGAHWTPVIDGNRVALIGVCTGFAAAVLALAAVVRRPPWPDLSERAMVAISEARIAAAQR